MSLAAVLAGCAIVRGLARKFCCAAVTTPPRTMVGGVLAITCPILSHTTPARFCSSAVTCVESRGGGA
eukprot:6205523-Pleurochrysis_carterae.AAC.3